MSMSFLKNNPESEKAIKFDSGKVYIDPFDSKIHENANYTVLGTPGTGMSF